MGRRKRKAVIERLGDGELELLQMLWSEEAVTISEAQAALPREQGYTTVQTRLERLVAKGAASKSSGRPARYSAAIGPEDVSRRDLNSLLDHVTGGSIMPLIAHLVRERTLDPDELSEIRSLIAEAEQSIEEA